MSIYQAIKTDRSSKNFGPYLLQKELGKKAAAGVYLATKKKATGQQFVIKIMLAEADDPKQKYFLNEINLIRRLNHPNIARIRDTGMIYGYPYFVMDYVKGPDVTTWLHSNEEQSLVDKVTILVKICKALHHAHKKGIIHGNIKPSNIILKSKSHPMVIGFGSSEKIYEHNMQKKIAQTNDIIAKLIYMPAEQIFGEEIEKLDACSDVYSVGALMYKMITGEAPFYERNLVVKMMSEDPPLEVFAEESEIPVELAEIVNKMMEKDPNARFQDAQGVIKALESFLHVLVE